MRFKNSFLAISTYFAIANAQAVEPFQLTGTSLTTGNISYQTDMSSITTNPAAASHLIKEDSGLIINMLPPIGAGYEVGKIDSLLDEIDELIDILDTENLSVQAALDAKDRFDPFLENAAREGMVKVAGHTGLPFFPIAYFSGDFGTFTLNINMSGSLRSTVLDDQIDIVSFNNSFQINTSAAVYVKSAGLTQLSASYGRPIWKLDEAVLHAGARLHINRLSLSKNFISLAALENGEGINDAIIDDYKNNEQNSTQVALDFGVLWVGSNFSAGLSIRDLNQPEYEYKNIVSDCSNEVGVSFDNCIVAQEAIVQGRIVGDEIFIANTQSTVEASTWLGDKTRWYLHTSLDLNDKNDPLGDLYQWASVGATAELNNWLVPEVRLGYRKNLAGTNLAYYNVGITILKRAQLDVSWSSETVDIDGSSAPRSAFLSFSFQSQF